MYACGYCSHPSLMTSLTTDAILIAIKGVNLVWRCIVHGAEGGRCPNGANSANGAMCAQ